MQHLRVILALLMVMVVALIPASSQANGDTYFTDFSEYTPGEQPSDWTERYSPTMKSATVADVGLPAGSTAGAALHIEDSGPFHGYRYALSWDALDGATDIDIAFRAYMTWPSYKAGQLGAVLHGGQINPALPFGTYVGYAVQQSAATYATTDYSSFPPQYTGTSFWSLTRYNNAVYNAVPNMGMAPHPSILNAGTWQRFRFQYASGTLRFKVWADADSEPTGWTLTATDATPLPAGWNGVLLSIANSTTYIDWFAAGVDGAAPPIPE